MTASFLIDAGGRIAGQTRTSMHRCDGEAARGIFGGGAEYLALLA